MSDIFASYAVQAIPQAVQRRQAKQEKPLSELDKKLAEKQRLSRAYRSAKVKENRAIMQQEPRLAAFARYVKREANPDELVQAVAESWLPQAPDDVRFMALRIVSARCDKVNRAAGFAALDDEVIVPGEQAATCYFRVRSALGVR